MRYLTGGTQRAHARVSAKAVRASARAREEKEQGGPTDVGARAGEERVDDGDLVAEHHEPVDEVRADETYEWERGDGGQLNMPAPEELGTGRARERCRPFTPALGTPGEDAPAPPVTRIRLRSACGMSLTGGNERAVDRSGLSVLVGSAWGGERGGQGELAGQRARGGTDGGGRSGTARHGPCVLASGGRGREARDAPCRACAGRRAGPRT